MTTMQVIEEINSILWGPIMITLLLGTGLFFTIRLGFIQFTGLKEGFRQTFGPLFSRKQKKEGISSFQALSTAIAAQVGTGNLAGVATAIAAGGPGAIFWMWISSFLGMATIFAEAVLAQKYRKKENGTVKGGPAYYIRDGLGSKKLAVFFAVAIIAALGFVGNMVQSNSIADAFHTAFHIPPIVIGIVVAVLIGLILLGGIKRIATFAGNVVPVMALLYIIGAITILIMNIEQVIPALTLIVESAFTPESAGGGVLGASIKEAIRYGVARGLFSNEAGMGSTPHAHAVAEVKHPAEQGFVAMVGVLIDTVIICTVTALVILVTEGGGSNLTGIELTQASFSSGLGDFGIYFIAFSLLFFSFTTILGWAYFGETNVNFLFGDRGVPIYRGLVLLFIIAGTVLNVPFVWQLADTFNAFMVLPNLIALVALSGIVKKAYKEIKA
ncbi:alanine/glycine:cation symporter family protein [Guptibacillus algicola]|uniref:alanine/glycine:cation symporter family protein n=1 Tax=Guptibacillus algicola TaxID=225844 RepID=UPI001CD809B1|nr:sodium:alanine symporter family protein [Alkalihalobacillus algicola]MCA0989313.1 sodium:alanine symporter family protein [Alkalihalobacillus algicola]